MSTSVLTGPHATIRPGAFGNAVNLVCRECRATQELGPFYACQECFGPLEIGYDFPQVTRAQIEAGPKNIWRYQALLPVPTDIASSPNMEPGFTRLIKADNLARELGISSAAVTEMLRRLSDQGLLQYQKYQQPQLTTAGGSAGQLATSQSNPRSIIGDRTPSRTTQR